jgi:hypothetical protein
MGSDSFYRTSATNAVLLGAMLLRFILPSAAVAALASASASAAPTLAPLKHCYVVAQDDETQREAISIAGSGFSSRSIVDIFVDEIHVASPQALYDGTVAGGSVLAPFIESGQRKFTVRLAEQNNALNTVTATSLVTRFSVEQTPKSARTNQYVRFSGRGFTGPGPIYAHYLFAGKSRRTVKIAVPRGDCGTFSVRRKQFSFTKRPRVGAWTIQFDQAPIYSPLTATKVPLVINVKKAPKIKRRPVRVR